MGLALGGCAIARVPVAIRTEADARPLEGQTRIDLLPESSVPSGARGFGQFMGDSFVVYRPIEQKEGAPAYRRDVLRMGKDGIELSGYTLGDGRHVRFKGAMRRVGDQLVFHRARPGRSMEKVETPSAFSLAVGDVRSVDVFLPDTGQTVMVIGMVTLMTLTALGLAFKAEMSEPLY